MFRVGASTADRPMSSVWKLALYRLACLSEFWPASKLATESVTAVLTRMRASASLKQPFLRCSAFSWRSALAAVSVGLFIGILRLDDKCQQIVQEANAIGTAYLRLDLLPADEQPAIRHLFRDYLDTRLRVYENLPDMSATERELAHGARVQEEIWSRAVTASRDDATQNVARLLLPASMR